MNAYKAIQSRTFILLTCTSLITGCNTVSNHINTERYLAQFIGQSSQQIQSTINFSQLRMSPNSHVIEQQNQLIYSIQRPMSIPIPMGHTVIDGKIDTQSNHYDVHLQCQIIFQLNAEKIAESVRYTGRAC